MAEVRHAIATWTGDLQTGSGTVDYVSSGAFSRMPVTWASRTTAHSGKTSPEELLAASHAACFSMALSSRLAKNGTPATKLFVKAEITFDNPGPGWKVATSKITVRGDVPGIEAAKFTELAEDAKENCPISKAVKGNVDLVVEASLAEPGQAAAMPTGHLVGTS
jgi:osmotically inducible protein OsmC